MSFSFINTYEKLKKQDAIKDIDLIDKKIPIGKTDGVIDYMDRKSLKIDIDYSKNLDFLDELPEDILVQIGDTFYKKGGACFKYEYLNQSRDYKDELDDLAESGKVYLFLKGAYVGNQNC